jgi:hypothetical protein
MDYETFDKEFKELLDLITQTTANLKRMAERLLTHALMEAKPELRQDFDDYSCDTDWEQFKNNEQPSYR